MKILVTGMSGQVAQSLREKAANYPSLSVIFFGRPQLDLEDDDSIRRCVVEAAPNVIVNAAAYTAVDRAEEEQELAMRVNGCAPGVLARAARDVEARLIHLSTDYVFDGTSPEPYREDAITAPINAYGRSKLAGEEAVRAELTDHVILRTAWVYSPFGRNFVRTMLDLARTRDELRVVSDQVGNPTSALDIAAAILHISHGWREDPTRGLGGTYHFAGAGETSWAGLAQNVLQTSAELGGCSARVVGISTDEWPTPARRPRNSRLDPSEFERVFDTSAPAWQDSVREVVTRLVEPA